METIHTDGPPPHRSRNVMRDLQADRPTYNKVWVDRFDEYRPGRPPIQSAEFGGTGENAPYGLAVTAHHG